MLCSRLGPASQPPACRRWPTIRGWRLTCSTRCPAYGRRVGLGRGASDEENNALLLRQLADVPPAERTARFICAMALVLPDGTEHVRLGEMRGRLAVSPAGHHGFGYDPLFVADGYTMTNGELEPSVKDAISHRGRAVRAILPVLIAELRRLEPVAPSASSADRR